VSLPEEVRRPGIEEAKNKRGRLNLFKDKNK